MKVPLPTKIKKMDESIHEYFKKSYIHLAKLFDSDVLN